MARVYFKNLLQTELARHKSKAKDQGESKTETPTKNIVPCKPANFATPLQNQVRKNTNSELIAKQRDSEGSASKCPSSWSLLIKNKQQIERNFEKYETEYNHQLKQMREFMQHTLMSKYEYILFDNMLVSLQASVQNMLKLYRPTKKSNLPVEEPKLQEEQKKSLGYRRLNSQQISTHSYFAQDPYDMLQTNPEKKTQKKNTYLKKNSLQTELRRQQ